MGCQICTDQKAQGVPSSRLRRNRGNVIALPQSRQRQRLPLRVHRLKRANQRGRRVSCDSVPSQCHIHPRIDPSEPRDELAIPAHGGPGTAQGFVHFRAHHVCAYGSILVGQRCTRRDPHPSVVSLRSSSTVVRTVELLPIPMPRVHHEEFTDSWHPNSPK